MALPLKSGADLYNNEALRMRLHNLGADPTEVGAGLIYFNTSTGLNTSGKARIYTGSAWKTLAFAEDLDVASNADFVALKEKVELLSGDVDTDSIISNMKEVSAFLAGFAEDASLMDLLNSKLSTSGGTISGELTVDGNFGLTGYINTRGHYLFVRNNDNAEWVVTDKNWDSEYVLLHSGNVGDYALKVDGSNAMTSGLQLYTLGSGSVNVPTTNGVFIYSGPSTGGVDVGLPDSYTNMLNIGGHGTYSNLQLAWFRSMAVLKLYARVGETRGYGAWKTLAFTDSDITGNAESATKLQTERTIWGRPFDGTGNVTGDLTLGYAVIRGASRESTVEIGAESLTIGYDYRTTGKFTTIYGDTIRMAKNGAFTMFINSSGNVTIGTSDLALTRVKLCVDGNVSIGVEDANYTEQRYLYFWKGDGTTKHRGLLGVNENGAFYNYYNPNVGTFRELNIGPEGLTYYRGLNTPAFVINTVGNVLIGTTEDNGAKLHVEGQLSSIRQTIGNVISVNRRVDTGTIINTSLSAWKVESYADFIGLSVYSGDGITKQNFLKISPASGDFDINGDLHVSGNIIADGEVSAGGDGDEGTDGGSGANIYATQIAKNTTSMTVTHNLGTRDVVVSIYERDATSTAEVWNMILTDIEITDANSIRVTFGSATTVVHKVVIFGASA